MASVDLEKIISNYKSVSKGMQSSEYSIHWESFHLQNANKFCNEEDIRNFRQSLSSGRDDSHSRRHYLSDENIIEWKSEIGVDFFDQCLNEKNIGNSQEKLEILWKFFQNIGNI